MFKDVVARLLAAVKAEKAEKGGKRGAVVAKGQERGDDKGSMFSGNRQRALELATSVVPVVKGDAAVEMATKIMVGWSCYVCVYVKMIVCMKYQISSVTCIVGSPVLLQGRRMRRLERLGLGIKAQGIIGWWWLNRTDNNRVTPEAPWDARAQAQADVRTCTWSLKRGAG
jgi:hypothetical protein